MLLVSQLPLNFGYYKVSEQLMKVQSGILRMTLVAGKLSGAAPSNLFPHSGRKRARDPEGQKG